MQTSRTIRPRLHRSLVLLIMLGGCTSWHVETAPPAKLMEEAKPKKVRVQLADHRRLVLSAPAVSGDSLVGKRDGAATSVALADIHEIAVRRGNTLKTVGLIAAILASPFAVLGIACAAGAECSNWGLN